MKLSELLEKGLTESEVKLYLLVWLVVHGYGQTPIAEVFEKYLHWFPLYKTNEHLLDYETLEFMKHYELFTKLEMHLKKEENQ